MLHAREVEEETSPERPTAGDMSSLTLYLREIQRAAVLNQTEEREVARQAREGSREARERLLRANLRFVVAVARPYARRGVPLEDLINEGNVGLIQAAERFDVTRGFRFITYAVWWIRQRILLYLSEKNRTVRLPVSKARSIARLQRTSDRLSQKLGREPTLAELGKRLHLPADQVQWLRSLPAIALSIDEPVEREESRFEVASLHEAAPSSDKSLRMVLPSAVAISEPWQRKQPANWK